ncbi:HK97 gp10 family phage protein [Butyricicoccus sp. OF10-2]|uniref:HK97 gp10 family phage protein n=1 Tax=Butyricicoccus sp. OF10-2 TaxID=2292298 RepID=UPI000E5CFA4D|nr:HK97 gp10 family phage protein [Butyricicoccus sp. OF10-2]RHV83519.1 HK97 gp10 family phage protein [Butyricicoccus sp. OF10-2]
MRDGFDCSELMDFAERLGAQPKEMLKAQKKMLRTSGTKLRRKTAQRARADVRRTAVHRPKYDRKAGDYHRSIKRGKVNKRDDEMRIRVYSSDKIGHLIEDAGRRNCVTAQRAVIRQAKRCLLRLLRNLNRSLSRPPRIWLTG